MTEFIEFPNESDYVPYVSAEAEAVAFIRLCASRVLGETYATQPDQPERRAEMEMIVKNRNAVALALLRIVDDVEGGF